MARPAACLMLATLLPALAGCGSLASYNQNGQGVALYQNGMYDAAIQRFQQSLAANPQDPDTYYNLGAAFHRVAQLGQQPAAWEQAEQYYNQCLDRNPNHLDCYRGLSSLLVEQNRDAEAERLLTGWVSRNPVLADARIELARYYEQAGNLESAKQQLVDALVVNPQSSEALAELGQVHERLGDHAQALSDYERSLWLERFQPELQARAAALRSALSTTPLTPASAPATASLPAAQ